MFLWEQGTLTYFWFIFHFLHSQNKSCNEAITKFEEAAKLRRADIIKTAMGEEWQENRCWWIRWAVCVNCCWKVTDCFLPEIIYMFPFICLHVLFVTLYICHLWCLLFLCDLFLFIKLVILGQPIYFCGWGCILVGDWLFPSHLLLHIWVKICKQEESYCVQYMHSKALTIFFCFFHLSFTVKLFCGKKYIWTLFVFISPNKLMDCPVQCCSFTNPV